MIAPLFLLGAPLLAQGPIPQSVDSELQRVTVYPGRALVERVFEVSHDRAGEIQLEVGPLPVLADRDSFQLRIEGGPAEVQGLEVRMRNGVPAEDGSLSGLRAQMQTAEAERRAAQTRMKGVEMRQAVLDAMVESVAVTGTDLTEPQMLELMDRISNRAIELDGQRAQVEQELAALESSITQLNRELGAISSQARPYQSLRVSLHFDEPGITELRLLYLVSSASWEPTYDVHVAADLTGVAVSQVARVRQTTGEDWLDAEIRLSTSMPSIGLNPPTLPTRLYTLPFADSPDLKGLAAMGYLGPDGIAVDAISGSGALPMNASGFPDLGLSANFQVAGRRTVRSGGDSARFLLSSLPLQVSPERYVVPSISDQAYLRAGILYTGDTPLVAGRAKVYLGADYLGETSIPVMYSGDRTRIYLGVDPNLTVRFDTVADRRQEPGILSSTARLVRVFRADLRLNPASGPVEVVMEEVLPLARDERIDISAIQMKPAPLDDEESMRLREQRGIYRWRLQLAPGASKRITWGYEAAFHEDLNPVLIDR
jgi:uncharacterized protein DUF4139/uncharacterized protein DUF4140